MLLLGLSAFVLVWRAAVLFTIGALVMLAVAVAINPSELGIAGGVTFATLILLAAAVGFGLSLLTARLERSAKRVAELREQQARVRAEERTRLAYELHDIVASQVTLIAMQARRAEFASPGQTEQILERIGDAAGQTLQDLRSLVLLLKSEDEAAEDSGATAATDDQAARAESEAATSDLVAEFARVVAELEQAGFAVRHELLGAAETASPSLRQTLARTLRELGTNILKHGDAAGPVELRMTFTSDEVTLSASNQISAAAPIFSTGTGLEAMRARSEVFGATLTSTASGDRWTTAISFPTTRLLPEATAEHAP